MARCRTMALAQAGAAFLFLPRAVAVDISIRAFAVPVRSTRVLAQNICGTFSNSVLLALITA